MLAITFLILQTRGKQTFYLEQRCPTFLPFATCGDRRLFRNGVLMTNKQHCSHILTNVATERMWYLKIMYLDFFCKTGKPVFDQIGRNRPYVLLIVINEDQGTQKKLVGRSLVTSVFDI
jgi:hypothetical protein